VKGADRAEGTNCIFAPITSINFAGLEYLKSVKNIVGYMKQYHDLDLIPRRSNSIKLKVHLCFQYGFMANYHK
jgi:hypothetical protein